MRSPEYYRCLADLTDQAAHWISLSTDKESLLATARALRERADVMEAERDQAAFRERAARLELNGSQPREPRSPDHD